jgi:phage shock protein PspC (stress-responsive transcriptional regulator)
VVSYIGVMDEPENSQDTKIKVEGVTLHRSTQKKIFGGVAGGIGERFDVDANIVRVVFVVLALAYGLGVAVYLAMWVLIPRTPSEGDDDETKIEEELNRPRVHWLRYALPVAVLGLVLIFFTTIRNAPQFGRGFALLWLIFLVVLAIVAMRSPARRLTLRRFVAMVVLGFLSLLILVSGSFLVAVQVIGVPLQGGSGVKEWRPTTDAQVQHTYHGAFGQSTINLLNVPFTSQTISITATQGVGTLIIDVPSNVLLSLRTHVGIGNVQDSRMYFQSPTNIKSSKMTGATLDLNLQVGVGLILIRRYLP